MLVSTRVARWHIFKPKISIWVHFGGSCKEICCYKICTFGLFHGYLVYFIVICMCYGYLVHVIPFWKVVSKKFCNPGLNLICTKNTSHKASQTRKIAKVGSQNFSYLPSVLLCQPTVKTEIVCARFDHWTPFFSLFCVSRSLSAKVGLSFKVLSFYMQKLFCVIAIFTVTVLGNTIIVSAQLCILKWRKDIISTYCRYVEQDRCYDFFDFFAHAYLNNYITDIFYPKIQQQKLVVALLSRKSNFFRRLRKIAEISEITTPPGVNVLIPIFAIT
jgi:hypothetical protein